MNKLIKTFNKIKFKTIQHSPEILIAVGVCGVIGSTVMACKATTKLNSVLEKAKEDIGTIKECVNREDLPEPYTEEDSKKDLTIIYTQTTLNIVKLYGPALLLGTLSIASIFSSNNILRKRNVALAAAYTTIDKSFKEYKKRVIDRFGEEVEKEIRYNTKTEKVEEEIIDEKGKKKKILKDIKFTDLPEHSEYARFYDESCAGWEKNSEYNLMFLKSQQNYANDLLKSKGYLFLNDVYDMLGIPKSKAGQVVGWVYDVENPIGDNYVDFGIYDVNVMGYRNDDVNDQISEERRDFVNGYRSTTLLDFNVDGNIWELM